MLKALTAERGESPNARRIERATAQARVDARKRAATTVVSSWKDPFAEDPDREVPVRMPAGRRQRGSEVAAVRRELARARAETAAAQANAAVAQAEAAQAKANSAKAEAVAARVQAMAARHEATAARAECTDPDRTKNAGRAQHRPDNPDGLGRFSVPNGARSDTASQRLASKTRATRSAAASKPAPSATGMVLSSYDEPEPPPPPVPEAHAAASPGGIIVVPITR